MWMIPEFWFSFWSEIFSSVGHTPCQSGANWGSIVRAWKLHCWVTAGYRIVCIWNYCGNFRWCCYLVIIDQNNWSGSSTGIASPPLCCIDFLAWQTFKLHHRGYRAHGDDEHTFDCDENEIFIEIFFEKEHNKTSSDVKNWALLLGWLVQASLPACYYLCFTAWEISGGEEGRRVSNSWSIDLLPSGASYLNLKYRIIWLVSLLHFISNASFFFVTTLCLALRGFRVH